LSLLANAKSNLSLNEALEHQKFLLQLNAIIKYFDQLAPEFFKFRSLKVIYSKILFSSEKLASHSNNNLILQEYKGKLRECILIAFRAVPFFRLRSVMFFFRALAILSIKLGFSKYKMHLMALEKFSQLEKEASRKSAFSATCK
jgi:hypothetical protein